MDCVVAPPGDHIFPVALFDVNVTLPPWQKVNGPLADMVGVGLRFTVTVVTAEVAVHPLPFVMVTL